MARGADSVELSLISGHKKGLISQAARDIL
jgi:hypothetical protein